LRVAQDNVSGSDQDVYMPLSQSDCFVLNRVIETLATGGSNDSLINQILHILRDELRSEALFVVMHKDGSETPLIWHDISDSSLDKKTFLCQEAVEVVSASKTEIFDATQVPIGWMIYELPLENNNKAALLGYACPEGTECSSLVKLVSSHLQLLLRNVDLVDMLVESRETANQRMKEIAAIYEIGMATGGSSLSPMLDLIVNKAATVMDAQACSLLLADRDGTLVIEASYGLADDIVNQTRISFGEGIAGQVAVSGEPMLISDVVADPRFSNDIRPRANISGSMCIPLKDEYGQVYGVLSMRRHFPKPAFNGDDLKLFQVFGTHAGLALSNAELYSRLNSKINEMASISDVLRTVNSSLALDDRLDRIADAIREVVAFDRCCVYLLEDEGTEFVSRAQSGYDNPEEIVQRIPVNEGVFGIAASERIPVFTRGLPSIPESQDVIGGELLVAPIVVKDSCIGVVIVDNSITNTTIGNEQVGLLSTFVNQAGIAVENARLYEAMQHKYDELNVLYEHSHTISAAYGLKNVSDALMQTCTQAVKCSGAGVILLDVLRGSARLLTTSGDMTRVSSEINAILDTPQGLQHIRSQRQPEVMNHETDDRISCPITRAYDKRWPVNKKNVILVPLITEDTVIGMVVLSRNSTDLFADNDVKLSSIIAGHAATVIRNAYTVEQRMSQRVLELSALYDFSSRITSSSTLNEAFDSILAILAGLVDFDESFVYVVDREKELAAPMAARFRTGEGVWPEVELLEGHGIVSWVVNESKAIVSPDLSRDRRFSSFHKGRAKVRSVMAIPLVVHGEVVAALVVHSENPKQYTEDNVRVLSIIASQGAAIFSELQALNRLASYTDNILASIAAGVVTLDQHRNVISWNAAAERISNVSAKDIVGTHGEKALSLLNIAPKQQTLIHNAIAGVIQTRKTYNGYKLRFEHVPKPGAMTDGSESGTVTYINMSISLLRDKAGNNQGLVVIFEDITHELEMETKFQRMSELASIGQLAANIAHELRNPLSSIKGAAQFLQNEYTSVNAANITPDDTAITEFLGIIIDEVNGLNSLTTEFLDFARPLQIYTRLTSVNKLIKKNLQLMRVTIEDNNVKIQTDLEDNLPEIQADGKHIEQILRNIILNALQAMPGGGSLRIATESRPGGICMSISDTGTGIKKDKLDRVFQPFFTTKTKGTGLGLSIVNKIVENHSGKIELESTEGVGTTFRVILPLAGEGPIISHGEDDAMERRVSRGLREL